MCVAWLWLVVFGKNAPHDVFVNLEAESEGDDVCDTWTAVTWIALLKLYDRSDEFPRWSLGVRQFVALVGEQKVVFTFHQSSIKPQKCRGFDDHCSS